MGWSTHFLDTEEEQLVELIYGKPEYILRYSEIMQ